MTFFNNLKNICNEISVKKNKNKNKNKNDNKRIKKKIKDTIINIYNIMNILKIKEKINKMLIIFIILN